MDGVRVFWRGHPGGDEMVNIVRMPKAKAHFFFRTSAETEKKTQIALQMLSLILEEKLSEDLADLLIAGLGFDISCGGSGCEVAIGGYTEHFQTLVQAVLEAIRDFKVDPARMERFRASWLRSLKDVASQMSSDLGKDALSSFISEHGIPREEAIQLVKGCKEEDVTKASEVLHDQVFVETIFAGTSPCHYGPEGAELDPAGSRFVFDGLENPIIDTGLAS